MIFFKKKSRMISERLKEKLIKVLSLEVLLVLFLFIAALFVFSFIAHKVIYDNYRAFDERVFAFFTQHSSASFIAAMEVCTFFGSASFLVAAYVVLIACLLVYKKYRYCFDVGVIALTSTAVMFGLKTFFHRKRPDFPLINKIITTYSFPSGHTLSSFSFFSLLIYLLWNTSWPRLAKWVASVLLLLFCFVIGISRIVLQVHFATDVVAAYCLGIVWAILSFWLLEKINKRFKIWRELRRSKIVND